MTPAGARARTGTNRSEDERTMGPPRLHKSKYFVKKNGLNGMKAKNTTEEFIDILFNFVEIFRPIFYVDMQFSELYS